MKNQDSRISTRLSASERMKIEQLIADGQYRNLSEVLRSAIEKFLAQ